MEGRRASARCWRPATRGTASPRPPGSAGTLELGAYVAWAGHVRAAPPWRPLDTCVETFHPHHIISFALLRQARARRDTACAEARLADLLRAGPCCGGAAGAPARTRPRPRPRRPACLTAAAAATDPGGQVAYILVNPHCTATPFPTPALTGTTSPPSQCGVAPGRGAGSSSGPGATARGGPADADANAGGGAPSPVVAGTSADRRLHQGRGGCDYTECLEALEALEAALHRELVVTNCWLSGNGRLLPREHLPQVGGGGLGAGRRGGEAPPGIPRHIYTTYTVPPSPGPLPTLRAP